LSTQRDIKARIGSVKNIQKITRAMEMVAAARLRRAEQRIEQLRPYARGIRTMTRRAIQAAERIPDFPLLEPREQTNRVGIVVVTGDRGLAGAFNSSIIRAGNSRRAELQRENTDVAWYAVGRRGVSSLHFRNFDLAGEYTGFTDRPSFANAREIAGDLTAAYADGEIDRAEVIFNHYVSPLQQNVRVNVLLPIQEMAEVLEKLEEAGQDVSGGAAAAGGDGDGDGAQREGGGADHSRSLWIYEPEPGEILRRLVTDYVEISIFRALLESTASEHGARMTAMRNAAENASELIDDLTLEANRARQADITQEIMEVVAGAEALT
jgi:F-type H+-transporting ATPase subunit gamma